MERDQPLRQLLSLPKPHRILVRLVLESTTGHVHEELCDVRHRRVQELEQQQSDVRGACVEAEVGVQSRLTCGETERVEEEDGLQLDEQQVLRCVPQLPVTELVCEDGHHFRDGGLGDECVVYDDGLAVPEPVLHSPWAETAVVSTRVAAV